MAITVEFRVCPLGNDGLVSYGGTASPCGGRARPARSLPASVIATDPAAATAMRTTGVQLRHHHARPATTRVTRIGRIVVPPMLVKNVTTPSSPGERWPTIQSSSGWSTRARPSPAWTAS